MNFLKGLSLFLLGASIGSAITWKITKDKYSEVLEVIDYEPNKESIIEDRSTKDTVLKPSIMDYYKNKEIIKNNDYETESIDNKDEISQNPYPIYANEVGEYGDYKLVTLYLFSDGILTNDDYDVISKSEADELVGENYKESIGMDEEDSGHIRNDKLKTDIEILIDSRKYHDALRA